MGCLSVLCSREEHAPIRPSGCLSLSLTAGPLIDPDRRRVILIGLGRLVGT